MRGRAIILAGLGVVLLVGTAEAGGMRHFNDHTKGCKQNVRAKIKAGSVTKADYKAEYEKCLEDPNYQ